MRFFDRLSKAESPHEIAASTRLNALTKRGRAEVTAYPARSEAATEEAVKRLFRLPDEISPNG